MSIPTPETMQCMDVWGGNQFTNSSIAMPGLDLWVYSKPIGEAKNGGDVYFISSCASGNVTRLMLADVSGHGQAVSPVAVRLHKLMRKHVNRINQTQFVESLNKEFSKENKESGFATAIVSTYFAPAHKLTLHNAGHPYPFICREGTDDWIPYMVEETDGRTENIPLGLYDEIHFSPMELQLNEGDKVIIYTDAISESRDSEGTLLSMAGLNQLLNNLKVTETDQLIPTLIEKIQSMYPGNLESDDTTLLLLQANDSTVGFVNNLLAPFRLLGEMTGLRNKNASATK
jgi:sigma-B regulation protein RsbU (phosphoserine phosphatase)